jgi:RNA polymerase subunit RPABC4/transcription elongation factor Spt4
MSRMTSCRACGGMIAAGATTCPRCGAVLNRISIIPVGLLVMLVIAVLYVLSQRYWLNPD